MKNINSEYIATQMINGEMVEAMYLNGELIWQAVRSCFGSGVWINEKPWINTETWKNSKRRITTT